MKEEKFLFDIQRLALELDKTIDNYDLRNKTISILVTGIFEETWTDPDDDIDLSGLLDGTGIFLN